VPKGAKIILHGAGKVGQAFYRQINYTNWCQIIQWVDHRSKLDGVDQVWDRSMSADMVVIAVNDEGLVKDIRVNYENYPIKVIWRRPEISLNGE
jgi:hypothetical protein